MCGFPCVAWNTLWITSSSELGSRRTRYCLRLLWEISFLPSTCARVLMSAGTRVHMKSWGRRRLMLDHPSLFFFFILWGTVSQSKSELINAAVLALLWQSKTVVTSEPTCLLIIVFIWVLGSRHWSSHLPGKCFNQSHRLRVWEFKIKTVLHSRMVLEKKREPWLCLWPERDSWCPRNSAVGDLLWALGIRLTERLEGVNLKGTAKGTRERARNLGHWPRKSDLLIPSGGAVTFSGERVQGPRGTVPSSHKGYSHSLSWYEAAVGWEEHLQRS